MAYFYLNNGNTLSSGEHFILSAEQSKKVMLFGKNTASIVDYRETVKLTSLYAFLTVVYPAKSLHSIKRPLDNIGIKLEIEVPENENNWIKFVTK